jgi:hypothetical protein
VSADDFVGYVDAAEPTADKPNGNGTSGDKSDGVHQRSHLTALTLDDILAMKLRDPLRRVAGLMGEGNYLTLIFGPSTAGKTLLIIDLVFALLRGLPWFGRKTSRCGVLYVAQEGEVGFYNRLKAYVAKFVADAANLPFRVITAPVNLGPDERQKGKPELNPHVQDIIAIINEMNDASDVQVGNVIYDNMRSVSPGLHENYAEEVADFYDKTRHIARVTGAAPIIIANTGKDEARGARGTQAQFDLADTIVEVTAEPRAWSAPKVRDGTKIDPVGFTLEIVDLGTVEDVDGEDKMISSAVIFPDDCPVEATNNSLSPSMRKGLDILVFALDQHGVADQPLGRDSTLVRTVDKEVFRSLYYERRGDLEDQEARRQAFNRFLKVGREKAILNTKVLADSRVLIWRT